MRAANRSTDQEGPFWRSKTEEPGLSAAGEASREGGARLATEDLGENGVGARLRILPALLVLAVGGAGWIWWGRADREPSREFLYANGRLEAVSVEVSAEITARATEHALTEGARVEAGDVILRLEDEEQEIALEEAEAESRALEGSLERLDHELRTWRHHLETARRELGRASELQAAGVTSEQFRDEAESRWEEARGRVGSLEAERQTLEARLEASHRRSERIRLELGKTTIRAPVSGTVLVRSIEIGELATPGRLVAELAPLEELELRVFVPEAELGKIRMGAEARVRIDAFPERFLPAQVARVDQEAQFTPRQVHVPDERTRMVFGVTLLVPNPEGFLKPGMPADAWIRWQKDVPWPQRLVVPS